MKKQNSVSEFTRERNQVLLENFRSAIARQSRIAVIKAFGSAVAAPAPRFWVSEQRAAAVIGKMLAGEDVTKGMYEEKRKMYEEIFERFMEVKEQHPLRTIYDIVSEIVNQPAPSSYMSAYRARNIINGERRRRRQERRVSDNGESIAYCR